MLWESAAEKVQKIAPFAKGQKSRSVAALKAGFGNPETYRQAKTVVEKGVPELVEAMDNNVVSISKAAQIAKQPPEEQRQAVYDPAHYDRVSKESKAAVEAMRTPSRNVTAVVDAFEEFANTPMSAGEFAFRLVPREREIVIAAIPKVREFIAAVEGGSRGQIKAV